MKFIIPLTACFFIGAGAGWYVGYTGQNTEAHRIVNRGLVNVEELYDAAEARSALFTIPIIESGDKKQAVTWFARPLAIYYHKIATDYYHMITPDGITNISKVILRTNIEQLASTNAIVADAIHGNNR